MDKHHATFTISNGEVEHLLACQSTAGADCMNYCNEDCGCYPECGPDNEDCGCDEGCSDNNCRGEENWENNDLSQILMWCQEGGTELRSGLIRFCDRDYDYWVYDDESQNAPSIGISASAVPSSDPAKEPIRLADYLKTH